MEDRRGEHRIRTGGDGRGKISGLARATGMSMEELAQFLTQLKRGGAPFITPNTKEDTDYVHEEE